ncbi:hypothetical protein F4778DRAFT_776141 [Xylariomycetidae sp. FL2044]|nr:hypothetical protein F4778DRAFT_776141 [Xylariomycetidae sp. FL2044]
MVTNQDLNKHREPDCLYVLADKKYFHTGNSWIKRTLRKHEWQEPEPGILVVPPTNYPQRWKTDAALLKYLRDHTNIPLPRLQCVYEDDGAFYHCTEHVPGVGMSKLSEADKQVVTVELLQHVATLRSLRSNFKAAGGRITAAGARGPDWRGRYVMCHNDLGQHNVIVDPRTLKISAIIDWEFGGFWPDWFERPFWERRGPGVALEGEDDDVERCRAWLMEHCEEVPMPHLQTLQEKMGQ